MTSENRITFEHNGKLFNRFIADFAAATQGETSVIVRKFALMLLRKIVLRTPVRTGRARAGWKAAGDALGVRISISKDSKPGDSSVIARLTGPAPFITMTNAVDYIMPLEFGYSGQAPLGMVRISQQEIISSGDIPREMLKNYKKLWDTLGRGERFETQKQVFREIFV